MNIILHSDVYKKFRRWSNSSRVTPEILISTIIKKFFISLNIGKGAGGNRKICGILISLIDKFAFKIFIIWIELANRGWSK